VTQVRNYRRLMGTGEWLELKTGRRPLAPEGRQWLTQWFTQKGDSIPEWAEPDQSFESAKVCPDTDDSNAQS